MGLVVVLILAATAVGFALGYAVRASISQRRRAAARSRRQIVSDQRGAAGLIAPNGTTATGQFHDGQHSDASVVPDQSPVLYPNRVQKQELKK
jgi:hypothetical protein